MHPFVAPVLLGTPGLDQLGENPQPNPPNRESTQAADGGRGERRSIVRPDDLRKPEGSEDLFEYRFRPLVAGGVKSFACEQVAGAAIRDGQRIAVDSISGLELAFVVCAPDIIGSLHRGRGFAWVSRIRPPTLRFGQPVSLEDV